jgi:hypothetical protein
MIHQLCWHTMQALPCMRNRAAQGRQRPAWKRANGVPTMLVHGASAADASVTACSDLQDLHASGVPTMLVHQQDLLRACSLAARRLPSANVRLVYQHSWYTSRNSRNSAGGPTAARACAAPRRLTTTHPAYAAPTQPHTAPHTAPHHAHMLPPAATRSSHATPPPPKRHTRVRSPAHCHTRHTAHSHTACLDVDQHVVRGGSRTRTASSMQGASRVQERAGLRA